ncbi:MAG: DUF4912 domain-containing protein, partial [Spirochaetales bacterium]
WVLEHNQANNHSVRIEETKYDVQAAERPASHAEAEDVELPDTYDENRIVVMLRDPAWAFAYWDIQGAQISAMQKSETFTGLVLRVTQSEDLQGDESAVHGSFDIPVTLMDSRWYIHLPQQPSYYQIALVAEYEESSQTLATSNVVLAPLGMIADDPTAEDPVYEGPPDVQDEILAQTGIQNLDVSAEGKRIPQRILDLIDEDLLFN